LAAILWLFLRRLQFPIPVSLNLLLMPGERVLRRNVTDSAVQTNVVVVLFVTLPTTRLQAKSNNAEPAALGSVALERGRREIIVATDKATVGRAVKEDCREEIANFA
jgi:hypothetical protein